MAFSSRQLTSAVGGLADALQAMPRQTWSGTSGAGGFTTPPAPSPSATLRTMFGPSISTTGFGGWNAPGANDPITLRGFFGGTSGGTTTPQTPTTPTPTGQGPGSSGNQQLDQWDGSIASAAAQTGVDPNLIKAIMQLESGGNPAAGGAPGVSGLMQINANAWGGGAWQTNNDANILKGAEIIKHYLDQNGGNVYEALRGYHGYGSDGYTTDQEYANIVMGNLRQLQSGGVNTANNSVGGSSFNAGNPTGNAIVQQALKYVGTPYVWGGIPGKGQDPRQTGWDCSGMTYWLDQNYGTGALPMGSHYQYDYAQRSGQLFMDTNQLQPGDLVFWDTGNYAGGGAELNAAGHVGIYIGNGKMLHAANPDMGTIVSDFNAYQGMYRYLGAMHSSYSGGGAGVTSGGPPPSPLAPYLQPMGTWARPSQQQSSMSGGFGRFRW